MKSRVPLLLLPALFSVFAYSANAQVPYEKRMTKMQGSPVVGMGAPERRVATVEDIIINRNGTVDAYILSVGNFLGIGGKFVAVLPHELMQEGSRFRIDATKDQLKGRPTFVFPTSSPRKMQ